MNHFLKFSQAYKYLKLSFEDRKSVFYFILSIIIGTSFCLYSSIFYPLLNSDDALNILMAHYYKLPNDVYCWGQNRGGTLIPLISQIFIKIFGFPAYVSVSISNYIVLFLGYLGFSSLFKNNYIKILFSIAWFFPPVQFIDLMRFPIGVEYSLIGFSILMIKKIDFKSNSYKNHINLSIIILLFLLSQWVSDLSIVTILIMISSLGLFKILKERKVVFNKIILLYLSLGAILIYLFINWAKNQATINAEQYLMINKATEFIVSIKMFIKSVVEILFFKHQSLIFSIYSWLSIVLMVISVLLYWKNRNKFNFENKQWIFIFLVDFFSVFSILMISKWVLLNGMGRWYFVALYISATIFIFLLIDNLSNINKVKPALKVLIIIAVFAGAISTPINLKYVSPKSFRPELNLRSEFLQLGKIGIISEYWNSYITSAKNPEIIKATPHEQSGAVRNQSIVEEVFNQPNLYIIKDMWFDVFPDTLYQFGRKLVKDGGEFKIGGCFTCKYNQTNLK